MKEPVEFKPFSQAVNKRIKQFEKERYLFVVDVDKETIWNMYLDSFPEGTNQIYKERREYDCNCCKSFVRQMGNVVNITNNYEIETIWDIKTGVHEFDVVAEQLANLVRSKAIKGIFRTSERKYGNQQTRQITDGGSILWNHFFYDVNPAYNLSPKTVGELNTGIGVFHKGLTTLTNNAIESVLVEIKANNIYRGSEHKFSVEEFQKILKEFSNLDPSKKDLFIWKKGVVLPHSVTRFANTFIGTLVEDVSLGLDLYEAIEVFESRAHNYKRPEGEVSPRQIQAFTKFVDEKGIRNSLERRYAVETDLSINDVLFVDRSITKLKDTLAEALLTQVKTDDKITNSQEILIEEFLSNVVPEMKKMDVLFSSRLSKNLFSLFAPQDADSPNILKWNNNFTWGYRGGNADSIKERVKKAGGGVDGKLRVSLSWSNTDDLDLSIREFKSGHKNASNLIYYGAKNSPISGGHLDIDMNNGHGKFSREPVENVIWKNMPPDGTYAVVVDQYCKRESIDVGFTLQTEFEGKITNYSFNKMMNQKHVLFFNIIVKNGKIEISDVHKDLVVSESGSSKEIWGLQTEKLVPVKLISMSPNHWVNSSMTGNKHYFFYLENCKNPDEARGLFNEYLSPEFNEFRKVFEVVGDKFKAKPSDQQLSGIGFSETIRENMLCRVETKDGGRKNYKIIF